MLGRRMLLFVDSRYREAADRSVRSCVTVRDVLDLQKALKEVPECGYESEHITVDRLGSWKKKFPHTKFLPKPGVIATFRRQKEPEELLAMRRADRITRELLRRVPAVLRGNITEEQLARKLTIWALELGAEGMSFDPIVAFGTHTSSPHHHPSTRKLQKGHLVQIDIGVKFRGYCSDASEVFFTATPTPTEAKVYSALVAAQRAAQKILKPGVTTHELDRAARTVLKKFGIEQYFTHALGHGIGLDVHEGVTLSERAPSQALLKHEVVTLEPGMYLAGKFGMRVERMVTVE